MPPFPSRSLLNRLLNPEGKGSRHNGDNLNLLRHHLKDKSVDGLLARKKRLGS